MSVLTNDCMPMGFRQGDLFLCHFVRQYSFGAGLDGRSARLSVRTSNHSLEFASVMREQLLVQHDLADSGPFFLQANAVTIARNDQQDAQHSQTCCAWARGNR